MGGQASREPSSEAVIERFEAQGQGHVFRFWDRLDPGARGRLVGQAAALDLEAFRTAYARARASAASAPPTLEPPQVEALPEHGGDPARRARAERRGREMLAQGRVAVLVVAGGQATRLGFPDPKGTFPIGPVSERSLFELQAQKLRGLRRRTGRPIPWYIMTSPATDAATRAFFERRDYLGLPREDVAFFRQGVVPSADFEGRLILEQPDRIFENPNGHGGSLIALLSSGALDNMAGRGIDTIFYYQVDNPLVRMADPAFLGFHDAARAEMSCKVVRKGDPGEKVGVVARADGRIGVIEYTELQDEHRFARDERGQLLFWAGNTAIHVFATDFVRSVAADADRLLPYHASQKKVPTIDGEGRPVEPSQANGLKFERFVFDALRAARAVCTVEAARAEEYSPLKNAEGVDSPASARRDLVAQYRRWLEAADIELPGKDTAIELDHAQIDGPDEARALGIRRTVEAGDAISIGPGAGP